MSFTFCFVGEPISDLFSRNAGMNFVLRNVASHNCAGCNDGAPAYMNAGHQDCSASDPDVRADHSTMQWRPASKEHWNSRCFEDVIVADNRPPRSQHRIGADFHAGPDEAMG